LKFHIVYSETTKIQEREVELRLNTAMYLEDLSQRFQEAYAIDPYLEKIQPIQKLSNWKEKKHMLYYKNKIYVLKVLYIEVIHLHYDISLASYFGKDQTIESLCRNF